MNICHEAKKPRGGDQLIAGHVYQKDGETAFYFCYKHYNLADQKADPVLRMVSLSNGNLWSRDMNAFVVWKDVTNDYCLARRES